MQALLKAVTTLLLTGAILLVMPSASAEMPRVADGVIGGTVTAVTADRATIKTIANEPFMILFAPKTIFSKQRGSSFSMMPAKVTDIEVGGTINVAGHLDPDGTTKHAAIVMILNAETSRKILENTGGAGITKVYGRVTAVHGNTLTITAYDGLSQVIEINDRAAVFKGNPRTATQQAMSPAGSALQAGIEVIEPSDIKQGDMLYAQGALKFPLTVVFKDNIFVASRMAVMAVSPVSAEASAKP